MSVLVTQDDVNTYQADGVVQLRGLFADHVETLRAGIERNMAEPSQYASTNDRQGETGLFLMITATGNASLSFLL